jgi:hypothetical protein
MGILERDLTLKDVGVFVVVAYGRIRGRDFEQIGELSQEKLIIRALGTAGPVNEGLDGFALSVHNNPPSPTGRGRGEGESRK